MIRYQTKEESEEPPSPITSIIPSANACIEKVSDKKVIPFKNSESGLLVKRATIDYLQEIITIENDSFQAYCAFDPGFLEEEIIVGKYFAATDIHDSVIGYFALDIEIEENEIYISNIAVKNTYAGNGIGGEFLKIIKDIAIELKASQIKLHVSEHNTGAINFYISHRFQIEYYERGFYAENDSAYCMVYYLKSMRVTGI